MVDVVDIDRGQFCEKEAEAVPPESVRIDSEPFLFCCLLLPLFELEDEAGGGEDLDISRIQSIGVSLEVREDKKVSRVDFPDWIPKVVPRWRFTVSPSFRLQTGLGATTTISVRTARSYTGLLSENYRRTKAGDTLGEGRIGKAERSVRGSKTN